MCVAVIVYLLPVVSGGRIERANVEDGWHGNHRLFFSRVSRIGDVICFSFDCSHSVSFDLSTSFTRRLRRVERDSLFFYIRYCICNTLFVLGLFLCFRMRHNSFLQNIDVYSLFCGWNDLSIVILENSGAKTFSHLTWLRLVAIRNDGQVELLRCEVSRNRGKRLVLPPPFLSLKVLQDKKKKTRIEPDIPPFPFSFWKDVTWCDFGRIHHVPMDQEE